MRAKGCTRKYDQNGRENCERLSVSKAVCILFLNLNLKKN